MKVFVHTAHDGLKALVAPDCAAWEAVPNRALTLAGYARVTAITSYYLTFVSATISG